jgi:hypothetical protein
MSAFKSTSLAGRLYCLMSTGRSVRIENKDK